MWGGALRRTPSGGDEDAYQLTPCITHMPQSCTLNGPNEEELPIECPKSKPKMSHCDSYSIAPSANAEKGKSSPTASRAVFE
jgi:hypothetical protein